MHVEEGVQTTQELSNSANTAQVQKQSDVNLPKTDNSSAPDTQKFEKILKELGITEESVFNLKTLFTRSSNSESTFFDVFTGVKKLDNNQALDTKDITKISQILKDAVENNDKGLEELRQIQKTLAELNLSENKSSNKEIINALKQTLDEFQSKSISPLVQDAIKSLSEALKSFDLQNTYTNQTLQKNLVQLIESQIAKLSLNLDPTVLNAPAGNGIEMLLDTLSRAIKQEPFANTSLSKEVMKFLKELHQDIGNSIESEKIQQSLKQVLENAHQTIEEKFSYTFKSSTLGELKQINQEINRPIAVQLKLINAQIKSLLHEIDQLTDINLIKDPVNNLKTLISNELIGKLTSDPSLKEIGKELDEFKKLLTAYPNNKAELSDLKSNLNKLLQSTESFDKLLELSENLKDLSLTPSDSVKFKTLTNSLENIIKSLLPSSLKNEALNEIENNKTLTEALSKLNVYGSKAIPNILSKEIESLLSKQSALNPEIKPIIDLIFQLNQSELTNSDKEVLKQLAELVVKNSGKMNEKDLAELKQAVKNLISNQHETNANQQTNSSMSKEVLKQFEQVIKGQEFLAKLNPLMNAAGEPIMILFPAIMGGLLTNFQASFFPPVNDNQQKKEKHEKKESEKAVIKVNLPQLGEVKVELNLKNEETEIVFLVKNSQSATYLEKNLNKFEKHLCNSGFTSKTLTVRSDKKKNELPNWLNSIIADAGIIA
ncbi:MAG: flagellar hook-length control protein FliK [Bdellovibrionales bacterium]|nr:flagellar hook-length control protein FliK [Bdellovibrionales bacterium]